jgi:carboxylesterase 1
MSDVVFVIFNYRLGPLGFANFNDKSLKIPGNAGMKDQQMAMRFVRDNIQHFGGDPDNITLMGHSSGGSSVGLHCVAESSKGLFHKAVLMSGSPVGHECDVIQLDWTKRLAEKLGYDGDLDNDKDVLDFLNKADVLKMSEIGGNLATEEEKQKLGVELVFAPHKELYKTDSSFLLDSPVDLMKNAWSNEIDIMIGGTQDEGIGDKEWNYSQNVPIELVNPREGPKVDELAEKLRNYYEDKFKDQQIAFDKVRVMFVELIDH